MAVYVKIMRRFPCGAGNFYEVFFMASLFSHYDKQLQDVLSFKAYYMYCHMIEAMVEHGTYVFRLNQSELMKLAHVYTTDFLHSAVDELRKKGLLECRKIPSDDRCVYTLKLPFYNNQICA